MKKKKTTRRAPRKIDHDFVSRGGDSCQYHTADAYCGEPRARHRKPRPATMRTLMAAVAALKVEREQLIHDVRSWTLRAQASENANPPYLWTSGNGGKISPIAMSDSHLLNAIHYCARRLVNAVGTEVYLDSGKTERWAEGLHRLIAEARRRGLRV